MAIYSPNTGIVDWAMVARSYGEDFTQHGGKIITGFQVRHNMLLLFYLMRLLGIRQVASTRVGKIRTRYLLNHRTRR